MRRAARVIAFTLCSVGCFVCLGGVMVVIVAIYSSSMDDLRMATGVMAMLLGSLLGAFALIVSFRLLLPKSPKPKPFTMEAIEAIRAAGGDAWDEVGDVQAFLDGTDGPKPYASDKPGHVRFGDLEIRESSVVSVTFQAGPVLGPKLGLYYRTEFGTDTRWLDAADDGYPAALAYLSDRLRELGPTS